jgi:hypothetical protein
MKQGQEQRAAQAPPPGRRDFDPVALGTLVGIVAVLMITFSSMRDVERLDRTLSERLTKLETQIAQVATRPAAAPAQQAQGIDPERVYKLRTVADAPAKGPAGAPVQIIEFSEFQ